MLLSACDGIEGSNNDMRSTPGEILFISNSETHSQLFSMNVDGSNPRLLLESDVVDIAEAVWSPSGNLITVSINEDIVEEDGAKLLLYDGRGKYIQDIRSPTPFGETGSGQYVVWFPGGTHFLFYRSVSANQGFGVPMIFDVESRTSERVEDGFVGNIYRVHSIGTGGSVVAGNVRKPGHSSVNSYIAYRQPYVGTVDSLHDSNRLREPTLSPNGDLIAYVRVDAENGDVSMGIWNQFANADSHYSLDGVSMINIVGWSADQRNLILNVRYRNNQVVKLWKTILFRVSDQVIVQINPDGFSEKNVRPVSFLSS